MTFDAAYRENHRQVRRYLSRRCDHLIELDDAVQETFAQAWRIWQQRTSDNVRAWLIGIARRVFSHMRRAALCRVESQSIEWKSESDHRTHPPSQELAAYVMQLRGKFCQLGHGQRDAMNGVADGLTAEEIAQRLGKTSATVRMALTSGRRRLREMVA